MNVQEVRTQIPVLPSNLVGRFPWVVLALIVVITVVTYQGVIRNGFVLDDFQTVISNPSIRSFGQVGRWFLSPDAVTGRTEIRGYRPVLMASYAADYAVWGDVPSGYHATNLLLHCGVIVLAFLLSRRLWGDPWIAAAASVWVALHPLNSEAVNYVTARSSLLAAFFVLATVWAYDVFLRQSEPGARTGPWRGRLSWAAVLILGASALGTKEAAAVLPLLIMIWDRARQACPTSFRLTLVRSLPFWGLVGGYSALRAVVLHGGLGAPVIHPSMGQAVFFAAKIVLSSLGFWLWPLGLAVDHAWPSVIGVGEGLLLAVASVGAAIGTRIMFRIDRRMGWCLAWFWVTLLPLTLLPMVSRLTLYQDNRVYLGGIGLAWIAGRLLVAGFQILRPPRLATFGMVSLMTALVAAGIWADVARTATWVDSERVWEDVLRKYPDSVLGYHARGIRLSEAGRLADARQAFQRSVELAPWSAPSHDYLGAVYGQLGDLQRALGEFETATRLNPGYTPARLNLGKAYEQLGRPDLAFETYERVLRESPREANALGRTGVLLEQQGRLADAAERYRRVLAIDRDDEDTRMALGAVLLRLERWDEARSTFQTLLGMTPGSYAARFNLGVALDGMGHDEEAVEAYQIASRLQTTDPDSCFRIAVVRSKQERWNDAAMWYGRALERDPAHFLSHINLARVAERLGDLDGALKHYRAFLATAPSASAYEKSRAQALDAVARLGPARSFAKKGRR
ncbi:MAG: tetratricopeptide repeat protein [Nitrospirae bacterium]|nr:tetratricopeptide repeat protein [Nitrospirota bacterium]